MKSMCELKLLPCPFCGGEATIDNVGRKYQAWCKHCCCIHMGEFYNTEAEAIAAWNRRTPTESEPTVKEELREYRGGIDYGKQ